MGSVGAIQFYCGQAENLCQLARDRWHDSVRLSEFLDGLWSELDALYDEGLAFDSLAARRKTLLVAAADRYQHDYAPAMRTRGFAGYDVTQINNASLIARHLYYHQLGLFRFHQVVNFLRLSRTYEKTCIRRITTGCDSRHRQSTRRAGQVGKFEQVLRF